MLQKHAKVIARWRYDGIYAVYNAPQRRAPLDGTAFVWLDSDGRIAGHFSFGQDGRIPTAENFEYTSDHLDIGLGLRPDLCGKGLGPFFVSMCMEYGRKAFGQDKFRLSVAAFNQRAVKVYLKAGFSVTGQVTHAQSEEKFYIMTV
nr:GNAT family protein [Gehongia tenuis]